MSLARSAAIGAKWSAVSVAGRHGMTIVTTVILTRLVAPEDFGLVAMAAVLTRFIDFTRDMGTGAAIVQADRPTGTLLSSVFWLNVVTGTLASGIVILLAPAAALFFREPRLSGVLRVLSLSPLFAASAVVHTSLLTRELRFRRLAIIELTGLLAGGLAGVALALSGYAVWSLVWQNLCSVLVTSVGLWLATAWRPGFAFEWTSVRSILDFSANLTGFNILNFVVRYADNFLIGRYLGATALGFYDLAYRLMLSPLQYVSAAFGRALFPIYVRMQTDHRRLSEAYLKVTGGIAIVAFPIFFGLVGVARPLVQTSFGTTWLPVASLLLIFGPLGALQTITTTVAQIYQAIGRTDLLLRWGAVAGTLIVAAFIVGLQWGIIGVAGAYGLVCLALAYPQLKIPLALIGTPMSHLVRMVTRPLVCSVVMLVMVLVTQRVLIETLSEPTLLGVLMSVGGLTYVLATLLYNHDSAAELLDLARSAIGTSPARAWREAPPGASRRG